MKTKAVLEQDIINLTTSINQEFPELNKYMSEIPVSGLSNGDVNVQNLQDYYQTLEELVAKYANTRTLEQGQKKVDLPVFPGYPNFPPPEDDCQRGKQEENE